MPTPFVVVAPEELDRDEVALSPDDDHHLRRVLRMHPGDSLTIADGAGRTADAQLGAPGRAVRIAVAQSVPRPSPHIVVIHALPKGRKLDDAVQMLVEIGVDTIVPVITERTIARYDGERADRVLARWSGVARAAAAQARRAWLPEIAPLTPFAALHVEGPGVVAHVGAATGLRVAASGLAAAALVTVAVGPEGGWTDEEVAVLERAGLTPVHLGASVLRTEHAALATVAVVAAAVGRFG